MSPLLLPTLAPWIRVPMRESDSPSDGGKSTLEECSSHPCREGQVKAAEQESHDCWGSRPWNLPEPGTGPPVSSALRKEARFDRSKVCAPEAKLCFVLTFPV